MSSLLAAYACPALTLLLGLVHPLLMALLQGTVPRQPRPCLLGSHRESHRNQDPPRHTLTIALACESSIPLSGQPFPASTLATIVFPDLLMYCPFL